MVDDVSSFWGPVTSTIESCEKNYAYSSYISEFYNTISNVPGVLLALIGLLNALRQRFEKRQQQSDETLMVWEILIYMYIIYSPDWHYQSTMPTFIFLYGAVFAAGHAFLRFGIGFKVNYVIFCLLCIPRMYKYYIHTEDNSAKRIAKWYVATFLVGSICWFYDRVFCKTISQWIVNPQGHALWHVFMGFNSYLANTFLMFHRAQQRDWNSKVKYFLGVLPYVKIDEKPTTQ